MFVVKYRKIFFILSGIFVGLSLISIFSFGLTFSVDFTGGALTEVSYTNERPLQTTVSDRLEELAIGSFSLRSAGDDEYILRTRDLNEEERLATIDALSLNGGSELTVERFTSIGPVIGSELRTKALLALLIVAVAIVLFVAYVFRRVSRPVASWKYGLIAIVALLHDITIPVGIFALLGYLVGAEIDVLFVVALLTILGYSVNDTIVVFDRVRENLKDNQEHNTKEQFELTVGKSLNQTFTRSINTSLTTILVLLALFFFGGVATENFALVLIVGIIAGTYSSICLASPLLVAFAGNAQKHFHKK